jgi:hypothetical protein
MSGGWASVLAVRADRSTKAPPDVSADLCRADVAQLAVLGNVPTEYEHGEKVVRPSTDLAVPGAYLKWYDIHREDTEIPPGTREQARDFLRSEATAHRLDLRDELGFVVLHRCGADFYYLLVCTWRNHNEMWQTAYARDGDDAFAPVPRDDDHHAAVQCVWELGATVHERLAWTRYLMSDRDEAAKRAYLADRFTGAV